MNPEQAQARIAELERERDEARAERDGVLIDFENWRLRCLNDHYDKGESEALEESLLESTAQAERMRGAIFDTIARADDCAERVKL